MEPLLELKNVSKKFNNGKESILAVDKVSFTLNEGEILGLVGESGSGKSTVAKLITSLEQVDDGEILLEGRDISKLKKRERKFIYERIQMVFQDANGSFSPRKKIKFSLLESASLLSEHKKSKEELWKIAEESMKSVGLKPSYLEKYPYELSGGECQRAAIARALMVKPKILICDEATSALDVSVQAQIVNLLYRLREEKKMSILFISHNLPLVSCFCDILYILKNGQLVESGKTEEIISSPSQEYTKNLLNIALGEKL